MYIYDVILLIMPDTKENVNMDLFHKKRTICIRGTLYDLSEPRVMGILNCTPDSFFDGGRYRDKESILSHVAKMVEDGVHFVDVGAASTRPGAATITELEEMRRLSEVLGALRDKFPDLILSVDTWRSGVASMVVGEFGVDMINDISSGDMDKKMPETIAELQIPYIAMHMQGTPATMQKNPRYGDVVNEIIGYFAVKLRMLRSLGVKDIIIDPGFGFGKTQKHNYILAGRLEEFGMLDMPILVGFSRKSMIYKLLGITPDKALAGTISLNAVALLKGANILRVHDVREAMDTIKVLNNLKESSLI